MRVIESSLFSPYGTALLTDEKLSRYAFSLCGGPCAGLFRIEDGEMLKTLANCCIRSGYPYKVLGGMTNILVSDDGFDGVVLLNRKGKIEHQTAEDGTVLLTADSGAGMAALVRYCAEHEISGMEWAAGLPGTVGGAVYGNAGAFGTEVSQLFRSAAVLDEAGHVLKMNADDMQFVYRSSALKRNDNAFVLLDVTLSLQKGRKDLILTKGEEYRAIRREKQPVDEHSLGSVFKNPEGESAGKLIQAAGLKGFSIGKASVSMKHANFITTTEGVTGADYHRLIVHVQNTVYEQFGILLEPEIELFGFGIK